MLTRSAKKKDQRTTRSGRVRAAPALAYGDRLPKSPRKRAANANRRDGDDDMQCELGPLVVMDAEDVEVDAMTMEEAQFATLRSPHSYPLPTQPSHSRHPLSHHTPDRLAAPFLQNQVGHAMEHQPQPLQRYHTPVGQITVPPKDLRLKTPPMAPRRCRESDRTPMFDANGAWALRLQRSPFRKMKGIVEMEEDVVMGPHVLQEVGHGYADQLRSPFTSPGQATEQYSKDKRPADMHRSDAAPEVFGPNGKRRKLGPTGTWLCDQNGTFLYHD